MLATADPVAAGGWFTGHPVLCGVRAILTCLLLSAVIIVAVPLQHAGPPPTISYQGDLATMIRTAHYTVVAPSGLPVSWSPVSSGVAIGGANGPGTVTWRLSYATSSGTFAALEESDARAAVFIRRMTNSGTPQPSVRLAGRTWNASANAGRGQRSLFYTGPAGVTVVVTGNASWAQLRVLAASLRPVPA